MTRCAPLVALLAFISVIGVNPRLAIAGPPAQLGFEPATPTVTAGEFQPFKLVVLDDVGVRTPTTQERTINLFAGSGDFYLPGDHGTPITQAIISLGADSVLIDYRSTVASGGSSHTLNALSADALSPFLGGTGYVDVVPDVVSASVSTITADSPVVADGTPGGVTVTSKDQFGNTRAGDGVVLSAGGGTTVTQPPGGVTNASGVASGVVSNTTAGNVVVSATVDGQLLSNTANVLFTAGAPNAGTSEVSAAPLSVIANGVASSTVTITVKDANGNPVQGQTVTLAINPPGNGAVISQPGGVTNAAGVITGTLTSTQTGDREITATVGGSVVVTEMATVTFTPGPIASFDMAHNDGSTLAGIFDGVTITARDAQGNVKTDYNGNVSLSTTSADTRVDWGAQFATNSPINGAGDTATYQFALADNGTVILTAANEFAETYRLNVVQGGANGQSGDIVNSAASASQIDILDGDGQTATVAEAVSTRPKVLVRDAFDNPVSGATVTFGPRTATSTVEVTSGGAPDDSTGATDGNGELDCDVWTLGETAASNTLRAYLGAGTPFVDFSATGDPDVGASLVISPNGAQNVTVGASPVVTLTLRDQYNNLVSGERVDVFISDALDGSLAANPGSATNPLGAGARWGNTNGSGQISVVYQAPGSAALSDIIDGSTSQVGSGSVTDLVYTTTASGGTNLRITFVSPSTVTAGTTFEFLVEAVDGGGNVDTGNNSTVTLTPEGGSTLLFSESDFVPSVTQVTLSGGVATVYGQGTKTGTWDIQVSAGGLTSDTDEVTIEDTNVIDHYTVTTLDSVVAGVSFDVAIQARDQYDNLVDGASNNVNLVAVQAADTTSLASSLLSVFQTTLVSGQANLGEQYTTAENIRIRVRNLGKEGFSGVVKVKPDLADRIFKVSGDGATVTAGAGQPLTVVVRDQFGNPVANEPVNFAATAGGGSIPSPVATGADGQASSTLTTGGTVATNTVAATILGGSPPDERVDFTVQTIAGPIATYIVTPSATTTLAGASLDITVTAKDGNGNTPVLDNSTIIDLTSDGDMQFTAASGALTAGVFSTTMFDNTAENVVVTAETQGGGPSGSTGTITVNPAGANEIVKISGDAAGLPVSARQPLVVEVLDSFGNPVLGGTSITFQLTSSPSSPDPAKFRDAVGDSTDGITTTNASGRGTVELLTASTAGSHTVKATILDGNPPATETKTFTVSTIASGISYYTVELGETEETAGVPVDVTVRAFDSLDNPVVSDNSTQVDLSLETGAGAPEFGVNPGTLTAGVLNTTVMLEIAEDVTVRAQTLGSPGINGVSPTLTIVPGPPSGAITGTAVPPTITATGLSTSTITSGVVRDQYANQVAAGEMITVATTNDLVTFDSDDQDGVADGLQRSVGAGGTFTVIVRSIADSTGAESITFASVNGSATGAVPLTLAQSAAFTTTSPPSPDVVYVGETVSFSADVTNTSTTTDVTLKNATSFTFSDGTQVYTATLVTETPIARNTTETLVFANSLVSQDQSPTYYAPTIILKGTDQYDASFSTSSTLPAQSLLVTALRSTAISAPPFVSRGSTDTVTVTINNPTTSDVTITNVLPRFSGSGNFTPQPGLGLPFVLPQTSSAVVKVPVAIGATPSGLYTINVTVTGEIDGKSVVDDDIAPFSTASWTVQAGADLAYVDASVTPATVSQGQLQAFSVQITNSGESTVTLNATTTKFVFAGPGGTYTAPLGSAAAIAGMMTQTVTFEPRNVPFMTPGAYPAAIQIDGMENGVPFVDTLSTADQGDQVVVQSPALIQEPPLALSPDQVSHNQSVSFVVTLNNAGDADVVLTPASTMISFDAFSAQLSPAGNTVLVGNTSTDLTFVSTVVSPSIPTAFYAPDLVLVGTENGLPFSESGTMTGDGVTVQTAPTIAITNIRAAPKTITADQSPISVIMTVSNNGGAAVDFTEATISFELGGVNKNSQFQILTSPTQFEGGVTLAGGATDSVVFDVTDNVGNNMSTGLMTIAGSIEVLDQNTSLPVFSDPGLSSKGSLLVQSPASLQILAFLPGQTTMTAGMTKDIPVDVVVRNNGQAQVQLDLTNPATFLTLTPPTGWIINVAPQLKGSGDQFLGGGETDTIAFTIDVSGSNLGSAPVAVTLDATETNTLSDRSLLSIPQGSFTIQAPGVLQIQNVALSRTFQTNGSAVPWQITVNVTNVGVADIDVGLPGSVGITFGNASIPPDATVPGIFSGGGTVLGQGETGELIIPVDGTGTYPAPGVKNIIVSVSGIETNSGLTRDDSEIASATIQSVPALSYVSLTPDTVSKGANVQFQIDVTNGTGQEATAVLDAMSTQFRFNGGAFAATLTGGPYQIAGGATETLIFTNTMIPNDAPVGQQADAELVLHWTENGSSDTDILLVPPSDLVVQEAPLLNIVELRPSQTSVTAGVQPPWMIVMEIANNGETAVDLDLSAAATKLTLNLLVGGASVSGQYSISPPTGLMSAGGIRLAGGESDSLEFTVNGTGTSTGTVVVTGRVEGENVLNQTPVSDDTFDGGSTSIMVQTPADLQITSITPDIATATVGQSGYNIEMVVENTGQATATLDLSQPTTDLSFDMPADWAVTIQPTLAEGGTSVPGGQSRTVVFAVDATGSQTGATTIDGNIGGYENNRPLVTLSDDTGDAGSGTIDVVTASNVAITSVVPSRTSITRDRTVDWFLTVTIENNGGSAAQLDLPGGVSVAIQDEDGGVPMVYGNVNGLEEGGATLAGGATGTLVIPVTYTGTFTPVGPNKQISVGVGYTDIDGGATATDNSATITVQNPPDLQYSSGSLLPDVASTNSQVRFRIAVQNGDANSATVVLNRATTRLYFDSGNPTAYSAFLDISSPDTIIGGATDTLVFESKLLTSAPGPYDVDVNLAWMANGINDATPFTIAGELVVDVAPALQIVSIVESQPRVTANMTTEWTATMKVTNNGPNAIDLYLDDPDSVNVSFFKPGIGDLSGYEFDQPTEILPAGGIRLDMGETGDLVFVITRTGPVTGDVTINGYVSGDDYGSEDIIKDDTFDTGSGLVTVQSPPNLVITEIRAPSAVTAGQGTDWNAVMLVSNTGQANAQIYIDSRSDIAFQSGSGSWTVAGPTIGGADNVIEGGSVDSLLYVVDQTGDAGTWRIDGAIRGADANSGDAVFDTTNTSGFGSIVVQTPPALRMTSTVIPVTPAVPNAPEVNTGQAFGVAVSVTNDGQATANNVSLSLVNNGGSTIGTLPAPIASVPAGATQVYTVPVTAAGTPQSDTFTAAFTGAVDANSGQSDLPRFEKNDSTAVATIVAPAALNVVSVTPSQATVTRGQSANWTLKVLVENTGAADMTLDAPQGNDVVFSVGGLPSSGYAVIPPSAFAGGNAGWVLAGGATDSLEYTIDDTGNDIGTVDIDVTVGFTDANNPAATGDDTGQGTVNVQNPAGLSIVQTASSGTPNVSGSTAIVNTGWPYQIIVTVQNSGEAVDSVSVDLSSDGSSSIALNTDDYISIEVNQQGIFTFDVTADGPNTLEEFTSAITYAISRNTKERVTPGSATDPIQLVRTETRADLSVSYFAITSPPGAVDDSVSTGQDFVVTARVDNLGDAQVTGPRELTLTPPPNFTLPGGDAVKAFTLGNDVTWTLTAPVTPQDAADMKVKISTLPTDRNNNMPAFTSLDSALVAVTVLSGGELVDNGTAIMSPTGAVDGVLSTQQSFTVRARVIASINAQDVTATLSLPGGFTAVGSTVRNLGNGTGSELATDFDVIAPAGAVAPTTITVTFSGIDINTTAPLPDEPVSIPVEVVPRTRLSVSAEVTAPLDAIDQTVTIGTPFTVEATVANAGVADIIGPAELTMALPAGYEFHDQGGPATKTFTVGNPVSWEVRAALTISGPDNLTITISEVPDDENSNETAQVITVQTTIAMNTEGAAISVTDITDAQGIRNAVVPAGATDIDLLAFEMEYTATDQNAADARIDTMAVTILGADGRPLSTGAVSRTLSRVFVRLGQGPLYETTSVNSNPVIVAFTSGNERLISPDGAQTALIGLDVGTNPAVDELSVQVRGGGLIVKDDVSGQPLGIVDATTGQGLNGRLTSAPLVILGSDFEEYVHNYPNPFRAGSQVTKIAYFLNSPGSVSMQIYAITGELVYEEEVPGGDARATAGPHEMEWDGRNGQGEIVRNGIYVCVLNAGGNSATFRIAVAK